MWNVPGLHKRASIAPYDGQVSLPSLRDSTGFRRQVCSRAGYADACTTRAISQRGRTLLDALHTSAKMQLTAWHLAEPTRMGSRIVLVVTARPDAADSPLTDLVKGWGPWTPRGGSLDDFGPTDMLGQCLNCTAVG